MTTAMQRLNRPCLQHNDAVCAHTMLFGLMKHDIFVRAGAYHHVILPISCFVQGRSIPMFTGGPPRSG
jgi:hypothetical protein